MVSTLRKLEARDRQTDGRVVLHLMRPSRGGLHTKPPPVCIPWNSLLNVKQIQ